MVLAFVKNLQLIPKCTLPNTLYIKIFILIVNTFRIPFKKSKKIDVEIVRLLMSSYLVLDSSIKPSSPVAGLFVKLVPYLTPFQHLKISILLSTSVKT